MSLFILDVVKKCLGLFSRAFRDITKIPKNLLLCSEKYALGRSYKVGIYKENMNKRDASKLEQDLIKRYSRKYIDGGMLYNIDITPYSKNTNITSKGKGNKKLKILKY